MTDLERAEALRDVLAGCPFCEWPERIASYFADACAEQHDATWAAAKEAAAKIADDGAALVTQMAMVKYITPVKFAGDLAKDIADGIRALPKPASPSTEG